MNGAEMTRFERRLCVFSFVRTVWFYMPVLVHHIVVELRAAGADQPHALAMSTLVIFSIGILLAEYPSGCLRTGRGARRTRGVVSAHAAGISLYAISSTLPALFVGQFVVGVGAAFRSGADSALLHSHLERAGTPDRYSAALARMRIATNGAIVVGCFSGGLLYAWWPTAVFIGTALCSLAALVPLRVLKSRRAGWPIAATSVCYARASRRCAATVQPAPFTAQRRRCDVVCVRLLDDAVVFGRDWRTGQAERFSDRHHGIALGALAHGIGLALGLARRHGVAVGLLLFTIPLVLFATATAYPAGSGSAPASS